MFDLNLVTWKSIQYAKFPKTKNQAAAAVVETKKEVKQEPSQPPTKKRKLDPVDFVEEEEAILYASAKTETDANNKSFRNVDIKGNAKQA